MQKSIPAKGQSSLEYILIVAMTLIIIIPTIYVLYTYSKSSSDKIKDAQLVKIGRAIVDTAETIFYSGKNSKTVLKFNMPENVIGMRIIDGREVVFNTTTAAGATDLVFFSKIPITTTLTNCNGNICKIPEMNKPGLKKLKVEAISTNSIEITPA